MIFQSFILDNLVALCMKIMNSVVVVGLYYGFLTTFSIGPSYLFLLRARVMEEGEEGTEKKVSATTGFITGQLMMLISIYYAPLHLALGRPHTITVIALPYLLFHFFCNNNKHFSNYGSTRKNSMRNFSIQRVFLNNLLLLLLNYLFLPSSMLVRLVNIYMFLGNKPILFLTSSFVSWLIGQILIMKWIRLVLVWIQENYSIKSNILIRLSKSIMSELINSISQIISIFFFISCLYYLGKTPPPILIKKLKETSESNEIEKQIDRYKMKVNKQEKKRSNEEDLSASIFSEEREDSYKIDETETKDIFQFEKPLINILFDSKRWNRPLRYIKNERFENAIRNEMSQYFFYPCQSDGKEKISFTYPPSLSTVVEMIQRKMSILTTEKLSDELNNYWSSTNEKKRKSLSKKIVNSAKALDKKFIAMDVIEKRIRLGNDETKKKHLPKIYDPFLNGPHRGRIKNSFSLLMKNKTYTKNNIWINKIHGILFYINYSELEQKMDMFDRKSLSTEIRSLLNLINEFSGKIKSVSSFNFKGLYLFPKHEQVRIASESEEDKKKMKFLFDAILTDPNDKTIVNRKKSIGIKEISKKVPRWSYKLIDELEQMEVEKDGNKENESADYSIRSRKAKRVVIFTKTSKNDDTSTDNQDTQNSKKGAGGELTLIRYSQQPDFRRDIIKGSIRAQRRKTVIWKLCQASVHSPLFSDKMEKYAFFSFDILESMKNFFFFKNWMWKNRELKISDYAEDKTKESENKEEDKRKKYEKGRKEYQKEKDEQRRIGIAEAWDSFIFAQGIRGVLLLTHAILRKYILFPSLIITKNIVRMLFFQSPEWSQDLKDWKREMHIKCTYDGVPLSETEFPKNWLTDGIQIKILFPFRLKPWHRSKLRSPQKEKDPTKTKKKTQKPDFCFLTVWGMEVESPFSSYSPRNKPSFFDPIFNELKKTIKKWNSFFFLFLKVLTEKKKKIRNVSKERVKWIMKRILFIKEKIRNLKEIRKRLSKRNQIPLFGLKEIYEVSETQKDSIISNSNRMSYESSIPIQSINWTNFSLTERKIKDLNDRTKTIIKQIEKITKNKKKRFQTPEINISFNKTRSDDKRKRFESPPNIWSILKRRNIRSVHKSYFFFQFFIERISIDIFLCIINIPSMNVQLFLESTKKIINKYTYHNEANEKRMDKTNQKIIHFISIIKKSNSNNDNSQIICDVPSFSQAYVFYKLSQTQVIDLYKYKLRSVFEYPGTSLFLKNEIKDYFGGIQEMCQSKLRHKKTHNSGMNQWKNWLRGHYQYDLSQSRWSILVSQKWRNRINDCFMAQKKKKDLTKCDSYEKNRLILYKKQEVDLLTNRKKKIQKQYGYDLLSYKSLNYADKKYSSVYRYRSPSPLQTNNDKTFSYNYSTRKRKFFDMEDDIPIKNYIGEDGIIDMEKNQDRQYFDWRLLNLDLRNKMDIEAWIDTDYYPMIHQEINPSNQKSFFFDWMGMNVEILNLSISNLELWFFSKFVKLYKTYKSKPWVIPIQFLFFNFHVKKNDNENKSITRNKKIDIFRPPSKKNIYKNNIEAQNFLLRRYLRFQLKWNDCLDEKIMNNIELYCLLLRLINLKDIAIASIQRGELSLDIMMIHNQRNLLLPQLMKKKGILVVEPVRLSIKNDGQFFMYQTIGLSLIHKSKHQFQVYQRYPYPEKSYVDKTNLDEPITRHQKMTENKEKNHYDLLVPENILSSRRRRELRILICFNSGNRGGMHQNTAFYNGNKVNNFCQVFAKRKYLDRDKKKLIYFKLFLWPNYRVEDLVCMNRYWFDTNNSSRFSMVRIHMYPRLKIR
uniref:Component of inner membrane protein importcomplex n=1 Tax=Neoapaloxylon tuberosum TaxID=1911670 RepID=A0A6H0E7M6_9FABA|nr:component of inner membrane protein importcomplex [Neoapaloxylon tuberosum]QIS98327.1 component of inner membrane protein importcomplex [Neoapaloxylon tuberosum]